jgi:hypothetical protein
MSKLNITRRLSACGSDLASRSASHHRRYMYGVSLIPKKDTLF